MLSRTLPILSRIRDQFPDSYEQYRDDSWHKLIGLRNIISNGYREIDFEIIWDVATTKLPEVARHLQKVAEESNLPA